MDPVIDSINHALDRLEATSPVKYAAAEPATCSCPDPSSFANFEDVVVKHTNLQLSVDFKQKCLAGMASLVCEVKRAGASVVIVDTKHLKLGAITVDNSDCVTHLEPEVGELGSALHITIPQSLRTAGSCFTVTIPYQTTDKCSALQWLPQEQTAGKQHPYLFSQCQAIHARSMLPCQDTPGVKSTYEAELTVPANLTALIAHC